VAEALIQTMRDAGIELALPRGTITREAMRGEIVEWTTIDLVWLSANLLLSAAAVTGLHGRKG